MVLVLGKWDPLGMAGDHEGDTPSGEEGTFFCL